MFKGFGDADYLMGINDPDKMSKEETESEQAQHRSTLGMVGDVATKVADPLIGLVRAGTTAAREAFPKSEWAQAADEDAARWQKNLEEHLTPYQKAVDASRWFPGYGERRAMDRPISKLVSEASGLLVPVAAGAISGGMGAAPAAVGAGMAGTFAAQGAMDVLAKQRDFAMDTEKTPLAELKKSPVFNKAWIDNDGDERAAREQFYNDTKDVWAVVANGVANGLTYGAIGRLIPPAKQDAANLVMRIISGRAGNRIIGGLQGGVEGALMGATTGATSTYGEQIQKVHAGLQPNVDPQVMTAGSERGAEGLTLPMAGLGLLHGRPPPRALNTDVTHVLSGQLTPDPRGPHMPMQEEPKLPGYEDYEEHQTPQPGPAGPRPGPEEEFGDQTPPGPSGPINQPPPGSGTGVPPQPPPPPPPPPGGGGGPPTAVQTGPPPISQLPRVVPQPGPLQPSPEEAVLPGYRQYEQRQGPRGVRRPGRPGIEEEYGNQLPEEPAAAPAAPSAAAAAPAAGVPPSAPVAGTRREWLEAQLQRETNPARRAWLEDQLRRETPPAPPPEAAPVETFPNVERERARTPYVGPEAQAVSEAAHDEGPIEQGSTERVTPGVTSLPVRRGRLQPPEPTEVSPGYREYEERQAPQGRAGRRGRASIEEEYGNQLPHDEQAAGRPEAAAVARAVDPAIARRTTPTRGGKETTGLEKALDVAINVYAAGPQYAREVWTKLRRRAQQINDARRRHNLQPINYNERLGEAPQTVEEWRAELERQNVAHRSQQRPPPAGAVHEPLNAEEQAFVDRSMRVHQQVLGGVKPRAKGEAGNQYPLVGRPLTTMEYRTAVRPLLGTARQLDEARRANGKAPIFEKSLPKPPGQKRSLEQEYSDLVHKLELFRDLPPNDFANHYVVRHALDRMAQINEERVPTRLAGHAPAFAIDFPHSVMDRRQRTPGQIADEAGLERERVQAEILRKAKLDAEQGGAHAPDVTAFRPEPPTTYEFLPTPSWVLHKLAQSSSRSATGKPDEGHRLLVENKAYLEAQERLWDHYYQMAGRDMTPEQMQERRHASETTARHQRTDMGTIETQEGTMPMSTAAFEAQQARFRRVTQPGTPHGERLRREAEHAQRTLSPEEARKVAREKFHQESMKGEGDREHIGLEPGKLPLAEELDRIADEAREQTRIKTITEPGKAAMENTRQKYTRVRDEAIKATILHVFKKHFGENLERLRELIDHLEIGTPPVLPDELAAVGYTSAKPKLIRAGAPAMPKELKARPKTRSVLSAAMLDEAVMQRIMEATANAPVRKLTAEQQKEIAARLKLDPGRLFGTKLNEQERQRINNSKAYLKIRDEYEAERREYQSKVVNQLAAAYEFKPIIDEMVTLGREFLKVKDAEMEAAKDPAHRGRRRKEGGRGAVPMELPRGSEQATADGRKFQKYTAGHAQEKADYYNMMSDLMNVSEQVRLAQGLAPTIEAFNHLSLDDAKTTISHIVPMLTRTGGDLRLYHGNMMEQTRENRRVKTQEIKERKAGVSTDKTVEEIEGGEMAPSEGEAVSPHLDPEQQMMAREPKQPFETNYQYRRRLVEERRKHQEMIAGQAPSRQVSGKRVVGTKPTLNKVPLTETQKRTFTQTEDLPPSEAREPENKLARIAQLELEDKLRRAQGEQPLTNEEIEAQVQHILDNRRNRPLDAPPPRTSAERREEVQGAREALATETPSHALISDPEPAGDSIGRAKAILERGEAGDVSDFITPEFLDKLSKVNDGVQVLHAPVEVVSGENREGQAFYQPNHDRIVLSNNVSSADYVKNVAHEHVHAATENLLNTDAEFRAEVDALRLRAQRHAEAAGITNRRLLYGLSDPHEFLSEAKSNPEFRALLQRATAPGHGVIQGAKNVLNALYRTIRDAWRKVVGEKDADTALDVLFRDTSTVLGHTDKLIAKTLDRLAMEGRPTGERNPGPKAEWSIKKVRLGREEMAEVETIKNPSVDDVIKLMRDTQYGEVRTIRDRKTGDLYAFNGDDVTHGDMYRPLKLGNDVDGRLDTEQRVFAMHEGRLQDISTSYRSPMTLASRRAINNYFTYGGPRRHMPSIKDITEKAGSKTKDLYSAVAHHRFDIGTALQTTMDLTHRGVAEFQHLMRGVAKVGAFKATMRGHIISKEDAPKLAKVAKWLNGMNKETRAKVQKFMIDETIHSAYADAQLNHPKNKHISLEDPYNPRGWTLGSLKDSQTRRMHSEMMRRHDELVRDVPEFAQHRDLMHKFFADRENQIREAFSRQTIEHLGILPAAADTPAKKEAAISLLQKYLFEGRLTTGEKAEIEAIKNEAGRKNFKDLMNRMRRTPELHKIAGPYIPLTRRGGWAVYGKFKIPEGGVDGESPLAERDTAGRPIDEGTRMFNTREEAEAFEQRMHDKYGIAQLDGGEWFLDKATGKRAREYTEEELHRLQVDDPDLRNRLLKAKEVEPGIVELGPNQYEKKYWVKMQPKLLEFHEHRSAAEQSSAEHKARHGDDIQVTQAEPVHRGSGKENEKYASAQMQKLIDRIENQDSFKALSEDQQKEIKRSMTLQSAKLSLRRGIRQQFRPREYVKGVDPSHLLANFQDYSGQTAGYLANARHYTMEAEAKRQLDEYMERSRYDANPHHTTQVRARDELYRKMNEPAESPLATPFSKAVDFVLKWSMFNRLAGVSYYVINGTEPAALAAPMMMDRHGLGTGRSVYAELSRSYRMINPFKMAWIGAKDAAKAFIGRPEEFDANGNPKTYAHHEKILRDAVAGQADSVRLNDLMTQADRLGLYESSSSVEYQRLLKGPTLTGGRVDKALNWATNVFQGANTAVENLNRFVTGVTAYRLEYRRQIKEGKAEHEAHQAAVDYATDIMYRANGDYRDWNSPSLFGKGPVARLAFQYKKYPQRVYVGYVEGAAASLGIIGQLRRGEPISAENKEKVRRLAGLMAVQIGAAGVIGLPTEILKAPINAMYMTGLIDYTADDAENAFRAGITKEWGPMGEVIADGFSRLGPVDTSGKMSMSNAVFFGSPKSRQRNDIMAAALGVIFGSGGQLAEQTREGFVTLTKGYRMISDGATEQGTKLAVQGLRQLMPVRALADGLAAIQGGEPQTTSAGKTINPALTLSQRAIRAAGFQPTDMVRGREAHDRVKGMADRYTAERTRLINEWAGAPSSERFDIQQRINDFNRQYPLAVQRITRDTLVKGAAAKAKAKQSPAEEMGLPLNMRTRPFLQQEPHYGQAR